MSLQTVGEQEIGSDRIRVRRLRLAGTKECSSLQDPGRSGRHAMRSWAQAQPL